MKKRFMAIACALAATVALSVTAFADAGLAESGALGPGLTESGALNEGLLEGGALNEGLLESATEGTKQDTAQTPVVTSMVPDTGVPGTAGALLVTAAASLGVVVATRKRK